ncbi:hypothetical protein [Nakamurella deserti]|uniref:hypothetical protein n=1 Tax=Nakamurella deserti TaxID=2164074 RepID=UPI000DBE439A|nr:hypothetical protein [Nakamurella deserti]
MLEPVGPLSPKTYWIRRVALVGIAVVAVLLLVWAFAGRGNGTPDSTAATTPTSGAPLTGELATPPSATTPTDLTSSLFPDASTAVSSPVPSDTAGTPSDATPTDGGAGTDGGTAETTTASATEVAPPADPAAESAAAQAAADAAAAQAAADAAAAQAAADAAAAQAAADAAAAQAAADAAAAQAAADAAAAQAAADAARPRDAEGRLICPDAAVQLTATVGSPTYTVGQQPIVGVTIVNVGSEPCVRDVSGSLQEYLAYDAAGTRVWSTSDCLPGSGTDVRFLQPGESLQYNIKWSGTTSQPGCAAERTRVPAGDYRIEARIGSLVSSQAALTFR